MTISSSTDAQAVHDFTVHAARLLADRRCGDVRLFDVHGLSQVCDYILVATGTSERQMKSVAEEVADLAEEQGLGVFRRARDAGSTWVLIDLVDIVVHLFEPNLRAYYDLDSLYPSTKALDWRRDDQKSTHRFQGPITPAAEEDADEGEAGREDHEE